jgi:hypothetical protein
MQSGLEWIQWKLRRIILPYRTEEEAREITIMRNAWLSAMCFGVVGGALGAYALNHIERIVEHVPLPAAVAATQQNVVSANRVRLLDAAGKTRAELAISPDGGPALFFYDSAGRNRLVLGLYSPGEGELPFVVLNDAQQSAAGIFRLFGPDTPVIVLKNKGRDRSIHGLNPSSTEPFLVNIANDGKKTSVFGNF